MTRRYLIKLATGKQQQQAVPFRPVSPVAQMIAMQYGVQPDQLTNPDLGPAINQVTRSIINGNMGYAGKTTETAEANAIPPRNDNGVDVLNKPYLNGTGYDGATDAWAMAHKMNGDSNMAGGGQNFDSLAKFKDINSLNFMGNGRNGGSAPVYG